uniref:Uncharacterized protein n=1 Tax=Schistocephalus solidus TaxID=70667 RepID=A0A0X3PMY4_SCHSO
MQLWSQYTRLSPRLCAPGSVPRECTEPILVPLACGSKSFIDSEIYDVYLLSTCFSYKNYICWFESVCIQMGSTLLCFKFLCATFLRGCLCDLLCSVAFEESRWQSVLHLVFRYVA